MSVVTVRQVRGRDTRDDDEPQKVVAGIKIDKAVPMPRQQGARDNRVIKALLALEVGESFEHTGSVKSAIHSRQVQASRRRFTVRVTRKGTELRSGRMSAADSTYRVWRTE
jgi:hypothetical protein